MRLHRKNPVKPHFNFGHQGANFVCLHCCIRLEISEKMAESQIKSKGQKIAAGCHHFTSDWDSPSLLLVLQRQEKGG